MTSMCGFFKGKTGIRQGDSMSPLLFFLLMEYFSRLMIVMSKKEQFTFHHRCAPLRVSHLIFADDLMLFCKREVKSAILMKRALIAF